VVARPIGIPRHRKTNTLEKALGAVVTDFRVKNRMSQASLAERLGYSLSYISKLERGEMNPTLRTLFDLADGLRREPDALIKAVKRRFKASKALD